MGCSDGMEPDDRDDKTKKLNEEFVEFMRKRSDTDAPRYTARLKTYVDFQRKRDRATAARRHHHKPAAAARKKADEEQKDKLENNDHTGDKERIGRSARRPGRAGRAGQAGEADDTSEGSFRPLQRRTSSASSDAEPDPFCIEPFLAARLPGRLAQRDGDKVTPRGRSGSRSRSGGLEPSDRSCGRRRRRRSCRRRRRRRRSCRCRRRRRRSCRRRRRSCRRRRSRRRRRRSCRRRRRRCRRRRRR